jgi:hypothetical protein
MYFQMSDTLQLFHALIISYSARAQAGDAEKKRIAKEQSVRKLYLALVAGINVRFRLSATLACGR